MLQNIENMKIPRISTKVWRLHKVLDILRNIRSLEVLRKILKFLKNLQDLYNPRSVMLFLVSLVLRYGMKE